MSITLNTRLKIRHDTTAAWKQVHLTFVPLAGEAIVYDDYKKFHDENTNQDVLVPGVKIGDGNVYLADLPFLDEVTSRQINDLTEKVNNHINNKEIHFIVDVNESVNELIFKEED